MRRLTELVSKPVISLYEGKTEGTIKNVIFNKALKSIKWLVLFDDKDMLEQKYISVKEIFNIGDTAVVIKNSQNIVPNIAQVDSKQNNPINCSVYTVTGDFINTVCDVILDDNFNTLSLELKNGKQIEKEKLVVTGQDAIILQDENNPVHISAFKQKKVPKIKTFEHNQKVHIMSVSSQIKNEEVEVEKVNVEKEKEENLETVKNDEEENLENQIVKPEIKENKKPKPKKKVVEKEINLEDEPKVEITPELLSQTPQTETLYVEKNNLSEECIVEQSEPIIKTTNIISSAPAPEPESETEPQITECEIAVLKETKPTVEAQQENLENDNLEQIEKELEKEKEQLKHKKTKLKEEIQVLKKQVQKLIKPKTKPPILEKTPTTQKHSANIFNESMSRPLRMVSNNTFLVNRVATKMVQTPNGEVIVKAGQKITQPMIELSFLTGKTQELIKFSK